MGRFWLLVGIVGSSVLGPVPAAAGTSAAPVVQIERPVRERISTVERLEFGLQVSNPSDADYPTRPNRVAWSSSTSTCSTQDRSSSRRQT